MDHLSIIGQVITVEDWSEIRVLARLEGVGQREIACRLGIPPLTVKRALDSVDRLEYDPGGQCRCDLWFQPVKILLGNGECPWFG